MLVAYVGSLMKLYELIHSYTSDQVLLKNLGAELNSATLQRCIGSLSHMFHRILNLLFPCYMNTP